MYIMHYVTCRVFLCGRQGGLYSYEIIYSNDKDKMAEDVLEEWYESEKSKEE